MVPDQVPDSSHRGFVAPGSDAPFSLDDPSLGLDEGFLDQLPKTDDEVDNFFQTLVAGIAGLDGSLVRPRWQAEPADLPDFGTNWASVAATAYEPIGPWSALLHDSSGNGRTWQQRHENVRVLCSFYGPDAGLNAGLLRGGLLVPQNRECLYLNGFGFFEAGNATRVPALIKGRWTNRVDLPLVFSRIVVQPYPILNLTSAAGTVETDTGFVDTWQAPWPAPPNP